MLRVLIVDDDPAVGRALARFLRRSVDSVHAESSAASALSFIDQNPIEVVITDADLGTAPDDGLALATEIRARHPDVGLVLMSGKVDPAVRTKASALGIYACVAKPFAIDDVLAAIRGAAAEASPQE